MYYGCYQCGKPIEKFSEGKVYALGCYWQMPFCSKRCVLRHTEVTTECMKISDAKKFFEKIDMGLEESWKELDKQMQKHKNS